MIIKVNARFCKGCNICVAFCPKQVLALDSMGKVCVVDESACIGCGQCELRCPDFAIRINKEEKA
ncbi:MAG: 4Fe-4S ferredoxin iron-sulfur binding protein [Firmicutes bacterium]|nr:4Fe-4S ferredoxin iron-sulfur binding protein [Bacillota bacterium]